MEKGLKGWFDRLNSIEIKFDYSQKSPLSGKKLYVFVFFIPVIIFFISYMILGVYPAGEKSFLVFDLKDQYFNYYNYFWDAFHGNRSLFNSWSRNLNGETAGLFAYYMSSPFNIIVFLLPKAMISESIFIAQLLKTGTAAVSFAFYLRRSKQTDDSTALIFSLLYSFMAYVEVYLINPMWLDGLIFLPLICLGIEKLVDEGRFLPFIIPLTLMFSANFYIGYMVAIFSCLYFLAYYSFFSEACRNLRIYCVFSKGIRFAFGGILSALCAAWLLIPLYYSLSLGKIGLSIPSYKDIVKFDLIDFFVGLMPNTYDTVWEEGFPLVYSGILTLVLIPLYFFNRGIDLRKRIGYGILTVFLICSMYITALDIIWHGFQVPIGSPHRYSFMFSFVLLVMAAQSFEKIDKISYTKIGCVFFLLLGFVFYFEKQHVIVQSNGKDIEKTHLVYTIWFSAVLVVIYSIFVYLHKKYYKVKPIPLVIAFFVAAEALIASAYNFKKIDDDLKYSNYSENKNFFPSVSNIVNTIHDTDNGIYRIEKNFGNTHNDAMTNGNFGIAHSSSTMNSGVIGFFTNMGFANDPLYLKYKGSTYIMDAIMGIKYVLNMDNTEELEPEEEGNIFAEEIKYIQKYTYVMKGNYFEREEAQHYDNVMFTGEVLDKIVTVNENPYALPIGFMADNSILELNLTSGENPFENQNMLLSSLLSDEIQDFFVRLDIDDISMNGVERTIYDAHDRYSSIKDGMGGNVDFKLTAPNNEMIYMYLPSDYERTIRISINGDLICRYYMNDYKILLTLGRFEPEEEFTVTASLSDTYGEVMFKDKLFYYLDEEKFAEAIDKLKQHPLEIESFKEDHIKGTVTAEKDGVLFTSMSYEPGWSIYVDGVKTEYVKLAGAFIGIPMTAGTHTVEMKFFPKGMVPGIVISVISIAAVVLIGLYERKKYSVKQ